MLRMSGFSGWPVKILDPVVKRISTREQAGVTGKSERYLGEKRAFEESTMGAPGHPSWEFLPLLLRMRRL